MPEFDSEAFELTPDVDLGISPENQILDGDHLLCISMLPPAEDI